MTSVTMPTDWPRQQCPCGKTIAIPPKGRLPLPHYDARSVRAWIEDSRAKDPRPCREPQTSWKKVG